MVWLIIGLIGWLLLLSPLFPSGTCSCRLRCQCGKKRRKAETRAEDIASQQARQAEGARQAVQQAAALTPEEAAAEAARFGLEQRQLPLLETRAQVIPEELFRQIGPIATLLQQRIQERLQAPPQIPFGEIFDPLLQRTEEFVRQNAARRGIQRSGLELEHLGRAGVDLAIQQAMAREQNRLLNEQLAQQTLEAAGGLTEFGAGLSERARDELANFLTNQQILTSTTRSRQAAGVQAGFQTAEPFQARASQFRESGLGLLAQREQAAAARDRQIAQALGTLAGGAIGGPFGATVGGQLASAPFGGMTGVGPSSLESLLRAQRTAPFRGAGATPEIEELFQRFPQRRRFGFVGPFVSRQAFQFP